MIIGSCFRANSILPSFHMIWCANLVFGLAFAGGRALRPVRCKHVTAHCRKQCAGSNRCRNAPVQCRRQCTAPSLCRLAPARCRNQCAGANHCRIAPAQCRKQRTEPNSCSAECSMQGPTVVDWHQPRTKSSAQRPAGADSDEPNAESSLQGPTVVEWHRPNFRKQCREPSRCRTAPAQCRQQCAGANRCKLARGCRARRANFYCRRVLLSSPPLSLSLL